MEQDKEKELDEYGIFLLSDEITEDNCDAAIRFILEANLNGQHNHLTLIVNSPGGCVNTGFALIDIMEGSCIPIHTVGLGQVVSMGLMIFIAGAKGHRLLTPNTLVMSHQWSGDNYGKEHELIAQQKHNTITAQRVMRHYRKYTGLSEINIKKCLLPPNDVFLTASEAKKYNICDVVKEFGQCLKSNGIKKRSRK